jgi:hydrogenase maturation protease
LAKRILVIGYGNSLRSDDCVGLYAVRELRKRLSRPEVELLDVPQLQMELAAQVAASDLVVFIDAASNGISGEINYEPLRPGDKSTAMSHTIGPTVLLGVAEELYGKTPAALLVTVAGKCFGYGTKLTSEVEASMMGVVKQVEDVIEEFLAEKAVAAL